MVVLADEEVEEAEKERIESARARENPTTTATTTATTRARGVAELNRGQFNRTWPSSDERVVYGYFEWQLPFRKASSNTPSSSYFLVLSGHGF
mmetsp:Transcript_52404/g.111665  ORF Transcript_52404/g.111665 Transcript_52404/m.111665 type:complete len:93 (-) Transcript_52404:85-363(-)